MATVLACGEGGSTGSQVITQINQNSSDVESLQADVAAIEASHVLLLHCESQAISQEPVVVDTPLIVEFGAAQSVAEVSMSLQGALTFNIAGNYQLNINAQYGRDNSTSTTVLLFRLLLNGTPFGRPLAAKVDNANILVPWSSTFLLNVQVGDILTAELMRDSAGANSGGLFRVTPSVVGWEDSPNISMQIYKV